MSSKKTATAAAAQPTASKTRTPKSPASEKRAAKKATEKSGEAAAPKPASLHATYRAGMLSELGRAELVGLTHRALMRLPKADRPAAIRKARAAAKKDTGLGPVLDEVLAKLTADDLPAGARAARGDTATYSIFGPRQTVSLPVGLIDGQTGGRVVVTKSKTAGGEPCLIVTLAPPAA